MKKFFVLLGLVVAVAVVSYYVCYHRAMASVVVVTPDGTDAELAWLKQEFALTPAQYDKVLALHHAYSPICADHCSRYMAAHRQLADLLKNQTSWSAEAGTLIAEQARIQSECHASMLKYAYDVAACMSPGQGPRYLEMIKMQLIEGDPAGMFAASR
ncbi:MAG TPA: hypothetical protein VG838_06830 [Opitutaceae bacterium]|nr:hypothetical protein [Lacunisphaera sp.]HWA09145.1 hypothetical protein [Opitutaceae bacterium]